MPKDYLWLTKDDRIKLLNIQKGKETKKGRKIINIYKILIMTKGD